MRASLLLVAALLCSLSVARADYFVRIQNTDAPQHDIEWLQGQSPSVLRAQCLTIPTCAGFNGNGFLKTDVSGQIFSNGTTLYVRKSDDDVQPKIWPVPTAFTQGHAALPFAAPFQITTPTPSQDLQNAIERYQNLIFIHKQDVKSPSPSAMSQLVISVQNLNVPLQLGVDESYQLSIPDDGSQATLKANTYYGALRGLETFSQLVTFNFTQGYYQIENTPWLIEDSPRFSHRGILLDTCRHFEPVPTIKMFLDSMSYAKLNVFHWHIVDSQSFPFESKTYPLLWNGAYNSEQRYTQDDVADVVEYARQRGIRTMIEFDIPGHAESWCVGYPDVCPSSTCFTPLDVSSPTTYSLFQGLFGELTGKAQGQGLIPDNLFHLGGDEVDTSCWTNTPHIQEWLNSHNMTASQAYMYIVEQAHDLLISYGRDPVNWEEVFNNFGTKLDKRSIIHIWLDHATLAKVVAAGYRAILSNQDVWYLDHLDTTWQQMYSNDPFQGITDPTQQSLVLGGESCMWGETVDTSDLFNTVWPRAAAVAERLWSPATVNDELAAAPRLHWFRCLLNRRGIPAAPVDNGEARTSPFGPGSCDDQ